MPAFSARPPCADVAEAVHVYPPLLATLGKKKQQGGPPINAHDKSLSEDALMVGGGVVIYKCVIC